ncbi:hypothetical protein CHN50_20315 [Priestia aryabhattai]|nr:hypothetical protein CHN50_20315 [Priestia aryabhattai]
MWLNLLLGIIAILGYITMWWAVFGKKKDIDNFWVGFSSSLVELIFDLTYKLSPTLIKRILIFLIGLFIAFMGTMGVIFA